MTPAEDRRQRCAQLVREGGEELVLVFVCRFSFGARCLLANQQVAPFFFCLPADGHLHAQLSRMILRFRVEPRVFVRDPDVVSQSRGEALVGFAKVVRAAPVKKVKPAKYYTGRENGRSQKRFNRVEAVIDQKVAGFVQPDWRKFSENAPQCVL